MRIICWLTTLLFCAVMALSGAMYLVGQKDAVAGFEHLGYPPYFRVMLGVAKLLGVLVLLSPGFRRLKEWAYAGFTFTLIAAMVSHLESGDGIKAAGPLVALMVLMISYSTRPASKRFPK